MEVRESLLSVDTPCHRQVRAIRGKSGYHLWSASRQLTLDYREPKFGGISAGPSISYKGDVAGRPVPGGWDGPRHVPPSSVLFIGATPTTGSEVFYLTLSGDR
jgi:hypothetical protein